MFVNVYLCEYVQWVFAGFLFLSHSPVFFLCLCLCCCRHSDVSKSLFLWQCVWAPWSSRWLIVTINLHLPLASPHPLHWTDHWSSCHGCCVHPSESSPVALHGCTPVVFKTSDIKNFHFSHQCWWFTPTNYSTNYCLNVKPGQVRHFFL